MKSRWSIWCALAFTILLLFPTDIFGQQLAPGVDIEQPAQMKLFGVGATLRENNGELTIDGMIPGSPAEASGQLHRGDRIIAIAQGDGAPVSTQGMKLINAVALIRGPTGSDVRLIIVPPGKTDADAREVRLTRAEVNVPSPSNAPVGIVIRHPFHTRHFYLGSRSMVFLLIVALVIVVAIGLALRDR
jgi:hypothetical protein